MQGNNVLVPPRPYWTSLYFWLVAALLGTLVATAGPMAPAERASPSIPPTFIANAGQFDSEVQFYLRDESMGLVVGRGQVMLKPTGATKDAIASGAVHIDFVDSNPEVEVRGTGDQQGVVNFYFGSDPSLWVDGVPTYAAVTQHELYPGIAQVFLQSDGHLKSEFHVAPGADPAKIQMQYSGAESLQLAANGDLMITTDMGTWRESAPEVFQLIGAERRVIPSSFQVSETDVVTFELGTFDSEYPLVIDPTLYFSTFLGGSDDDGGGDIAIDGDGNVLVMGGTRSSDFPLVNEVSATNFGNIDMFVSKLDPTGSALLFSTYLGGSGREFGTDIAVDTDDNAYGLGWTASNNFPTTVGVLDDMYSGSDDAAVFKLDPTGALVYSTFLGGSGDDQPEGIVVDGAGQAFVVGNSSSSSFPTTPGAYSNTVQGVWDTFVSKLDVNAANLVYSTFIGGSGYDEPMAIAIDFDGNAYVTGRTQSSDYPIGGVGGGPVYDSTYDGTDTAFLTKLNADGDDLIYSTFLDGISPRFGARQLDVEVDAGQFAYVMAPTEGTGFPATSGAYDTSFNGGIDTVLMKVEPDAGALVYSTFLGGSGEERGTRIMVDSTGSVHVTGSTTSIDFPTVDPISSSLNGTLDMFVARLSPDGSALPFSTYLGGSENDSANGIDLAPRGPCITGVTTSTDYPTLAPLPFVPFQANFGGGDNDAVVTCLDAPGPSEGCLKPPSGMAYWAPFDEEFGTTTADLVAGNNGTHMGSAAPTGGIVAGAIDLGDGHVAVPSAGALDLGEESFTLDFWIREPDYPPFGTVVAKHDPISGQGFEVYWDLCGCTPDFAQLFIDINGIPHALNLLVREGNSLPWTQVVIVVDRNLGLIFIYVNGSLQGVLPLLVPSGASVDNTEPLLIGQGVNGPGDFSGQLDELEIFRRSLAAVEVQELYAADSLGKCKERVHVGWDAKICEPRKFVRVSVEVCNDSTTPQDHELDFAPLGLGPKCTVSGPTDFEHAVTGALPPLAVTVPAQSCVRVPVKVRRPADMDAHGEIGCYEVIRRNVATGSTRIIAGSVQDQRNTCPVPLPVDLEPDFSSDVRVVPTDSSIEIAFLIGNRAATPLPVNYEIQASPSDGEGSQAAVRLDDGEPGEPVQGMTVIPPLGNVAITVNVHNVGIEAFSYQDLVISTDTAGPGTLVPFDSAGLRLPLPTEALSVNHDSAITLQDTAVLVDVLANDFGLTSPLDPNSVQVLGGPFHGTAAVNGSGDITYTPGTGFSGGDGLLYEVCVTGGTCGTAVVRLVVTAKGDPIIFADGFETGDTSAWSATVP